MEYSIWHQKVTVWSTPYGNIYSQMELILKHSIRHQKCARWSTPYGHYLMPYGVLHTVTIYCLMEYSIWSLWSSHFHVGKQILRFYTGQKRQDDNMCEFKDVGSLIFSIQDQYSVIFEFVGILWDLQNLHSM